MVNAIAVIVGYAAVIVLVVWLIMRAVFGPVRKDGEGL